MPPVTDPSAPLLVSIIMPAYNAEATIAESLETVQHQTSPNWELVVVDDGSGDGTAAIVKRASRKDPRIKYLRQRNAGVSSARNRGVASASFDWLLHLDADDWLDPAYLEKMTAVLAANSSWDGVHCGWVRVTPDGRRVDEHYYPSSGDLFEPFTRFCAFSVHACVVRKSLVTGVGGWDTTLRTCEDWDLWQRVARTGAQFAELHQVLALYRMRPGSASRDAGRYVEDGVRVIQRAHSRDPRVRLPHPQHAAGAPADNLAEALFRFICWPAGLVLGAGGDACPLLDKLPVMYCHTLNHEAVAGTIMDAAPLPDALPPDAWPELWARIETRLNAFLHALEKRAGAGPVALRVLRAMQDRIATAAPAGRPVDVGQLRVLSLEITDPLPTLQFPGGEGRLICAVDLEGKRLGLIRLPVADECGPWLLADAVSAEYAWDVLGAFFGRTVYRTLSLTGETGCAVTRGAVCLVDRLFAGDVFEQIHSRAGWTVFLQELWGRPEWPMASFYDENTPEEGAPRRRVAAGRVVIIEISDELPDLNVENAEVALDIRLGGLPIGWMPLRSVGPIVRAQQLRAWLTEALGRELCRITVRDVLIGTPLTDGTLRSRLVAARSKPLALSTLGAQQAGTHPGQGTERRAGRSTWNGIVLARRRLGAVGTSASRRAMFPAEVAPDLLAATAACGDAVVRVTPSPASEVEWVAYAPEVIRAQSEPLGTRRPPTSPAASGSPSTRRLPILMYHRVADGVTGEAAKYCVTPGAFESHLRLLREAGAYCLAFDEWRVACEKRHPLAGFPIVITFDDGYLDFRDAAWPLLKRYGFSAHVFVVTGDAGASNRWDSPGGAAVPLMGWDDLRRLRDEGVEIGSHSVTHPDLTTLSHADVVREATRSQVSIVRELGQAALSFAYPYGATDEFVAHLVGSCGYVFGLSCRSGQAGHKDRLLDLPRVEVVGTDTADDVGRKVGL
jgi:peptidoglycan/xylan/chitin deacetylase (PgdA/CDA1 family)